MGVIRALIGVIRAVVGVRVGIGHPEKMSVVDWVLSKFTAEQRQTIDVTANEVVAALDYWLASDDFMKTMNKYNHK